MDQLFTVELRHEHDVVLARQRARQLAELLGFEGQDQTRIATAVSEIARNAWEYAHGGRVIFSLDEERVLYIEISDNGPGIADAETILAGRYTSSTGLGQGIIGAKRLMDALTITSAPGGPTRVVLRKNLPRRTLRGAKPLDLNTIRRSLLQSAPSTPFQELQRQNKELALALDTLRARETELEELNRELSDTNRGVMALYAELDEKNQELQQASELKTRFLSNMSHEFRTPLNSVMGLAQLLLNRADGPLTPEQQKQATFIYRSAQSMAEMVNDLLDTAKIEAGKVDIDPQEFLISDLFSSLRGVFRPLVSSGNVSLYFADATDLPPLFTDERKVAQILRNLVSNALKFTERGTVWVLATLAAGDTVVFTVVDEGIGIAPDDCTLIFEEFMQITGAVQKRVQGTGLGLPLSRRLARLLGGDMAVQSTPGTGSTFTVTLPRHYSGETP